MILGSFWPGRNGSPCRRTLPYRTMVVTATLSTSALSLIMVPRAPMSAPYAICALAVRVKVPSAATCDTRVGEG